MMLMVMCLLPNVVAENEALLHLFVALGLCRALQRKYLNICIFEHILKFVYLKTFFYLSMLQPVWLCSTACEPPPSSKG